MIFKSSWVIWPHRIFANYYVCNIRTSTTVEDNGEKVDRQTRHINHVFVHIETTIESKEREASTVQTKNKTKQKCTESLPLRSELILVRSCANINNVVCVCCCTLALATPGNIKLFHQLYALLFLGCIFLHYCDRRAMHQFG